jgi:hypothetical protein
MRLQPGFRQQILGPFNPHPCDFMSHAAAQMLVEAAFERPPVEARLLRHIGETDRFRETLPNEAENSRGRESGTARMLALMRIQTSYAPLCKQDIHAGSHGIAVHFAGAFL